jgi:hypothetical protein
MYSYQPRVMATSQERRLEYHSQAGLEPGTSRFSTLRINHYAARGIHLFTRAHAHSQSLSISAHPCIIRHLLTFVFVSSCLCLSSPSLKPDRAHALQPRVTPPSLAAGGSSSAVCVACPAGTYNGSTGVYALDSLCKDKHGLQAVRRTALRGTTWLALSSGSLSQVSFHSLNSFLDPAAQPLALSFPLS